MSFSINFERKITSFFFRFILFYIVSCISTQLLFTIALAHMCMCQTAMTITTKPKILKHKYKMERTNEIEMKRNIGKSTNGDGSIKKNEIYNYMFYCKKTKESKKIEKLNMKIVFKEKKIYL